MQRPSADDVISLSTDMHKSSFSALTLFAEEEAGSVKGVGEKEKPFLTCEEWTVPLRLRQIRRD